MKERLENDEYTENFETYHRPRSHTLVKATAIFCFTLIIGAGMALFYAQYTDRFSIITTKEGVFVFDRKEASLNHCDNDANCKTILLARSPIETAKAVCENMVEQGRVATSSIGGGLIPFQQESGKPADLSPPPSSSPQGYPQTQAPLTPSMILGEGIPKGTPTAGVQHQLQAAQNMINTPVQVMPSIQAPMMAQSQPQRIIPASASARALPSRQPTSQVSSDDDTGDGSDNQDTTSGTFNAGALDNEEDNSDDTTSDDSAVDSPGDDSSDDNSDDGSNDSNNG